MTKVKKIHAYEIIDSAGNPTLEGRLVLDNGVEVVTSVPSGTTIGKYEANELRDGDPYRFNGLGVSRAAFYINELIAPKLVGVSPSKQKEVDYWLIKADATATKSKLGANTILIISQLFAKAGAIEAGVPLFRYINYLYEQTFKKKLEIKRIPTPIFGIINGGKHANNNLNFQEFQVISSSSYTFSQAYQRAIEIFHEMKKMLEYRNAVVSLGEEGGFTPYLATNIDALEILSETIRSRNLRLGLDTFLGIDIAASHFYKDERYIIKDKPSPLNAKEFLEYIKNLAKKYSILVLEDPLNQDDWENWKNLEQNINKEIYLVGDDLLASNKERLQKAIREKACSAVLIKPNQIGTVSENLEIVDIARENNFAYIVAQRSSETNDSFIADLAVGIQSDFVKFGAPARGERVAKYNRLWQIERDELQK